MNLLLKKQKNKQKTMLLFLWIVGVTKKIPTINPSFRDLFNAEYVFSSVTLALFMADSFFSSYCTHT